MDAPTISLWVQLKITSHWSIVICFSQQVFYLEIACLNSFFPPSQVMNGLIISHNVKDHTNGSAPLRSLPVNTFNSLYLTSTRMALLECKVIHYLIIVQISALKQNGLLQTLAAGGDQPKPAGNSHILSHGCFFVSHPLPPGICVYPRYKVAVAGKTSLRSAVCTGPQWQWCCRSVWLEGFMTENEQDGCRPSHHSPLAE